MPTLHGLRAQAERLLQRAEATPLAEWQISAEEHSTMVSLANAFNVSLPLTAFKSAEGAAQFVRLALVAMGGGGTVATRAG
jgi:hypothetical protein